MFSYHLSLTEIVSGYFFLSIHYDCSQNACTTEQSIVCLCVFPILRRVCCCIIGRFYFVEVWNTKRLLWPGRHFAVTTNAYLRAARMCSLANLILLLSDLIQVMKFCI